MRLLFVILFVFFSAALSAQNDSLRQLFYKAESNYEIGKFDEALEILEGNFSKFPAALKTNVLKLSALCSIMKDDDEKSVRYTSMLLQENPGYTPLDAPQRFKDLVAELKHGGSNTVSTASADSETLDEVPVPVTLITEDMIRASGVHTVQDLLLLYVPGVTNLEINGIMSFAMHGIYGMSQEKVLIMINGIRLNSYSTNLGLADYSISLEKIKQIEVLRGPASSLYGDVALTGVVNIITKDGRDIDGFQAGVSAGNFGQFHGSAMFGKHLYDADIFAWGAFYRSDGEFVKAQVDTMFSTLNYPEHVIVGGFNHKPAYDCGANIKYKGFSVMYTCNSSKTVTPFTKDQSDVFVPYSYYKYAEYDGNLPGPAYTTQNVRARYEKSFKKLDASLSATYYREKMSKYMVAGDTVLYQTFDMWGYNEETYEIESKSCTTGLADYMVWEDINMSLSGRIAYNYGNRHCGGIITVGTDLSCFKKNYTQHCEIYDYVKQYSPTVYDYYSFGNKEQKNALYLQVKHRWGRLIINTGFRYDYKRRCEINTDNSILSFEAEKIDSINADAKIHEFSPRISFIYTTDKVNLKLNYSKSFVDAPYLYRTNELFIILFDKMLTPERLNSYQFTVTGKNFPKNLTTELNFFYNDCKGLVMPWENIAYINWDLRMAGVEAVATYSCGGFSLNANATFQKVADYKPFENGYGDYSLIVNGNVLNTPNFFVNALLSYRFNKTVRANIGINYCGKQYFKFRIYENPIDWEESYKEISQYFLVNPGLNFDFGKLKLDINIHNVFNHKYSLGGNCFREIPQKGLWLMAGVSYNF